MGRAGWRRPQVKGLARTFTEGDLVVQFSFLQGELAAAEIRLVPGWERFVRCMLDTERVEIFVTGSSAALLSREVATAFRGRA